MRNTSASRCFLLNCKTTRLQCGHGKPMSRELKCVEIKMMKSEEAQHASSNAIIHEASLRGSEPRFIELNKVLEEKVNSLMSDVDSILKKQTHLMHLPKRHNDKKQDATAQLEPRNGSRKIESAKKEMSLDSRDDEINWMSNGDRGSLQINHSRPKKSTKSPSEAALRFFEGQITKLHSDLNTMQYEKKKMEEKCKDLEAQLSKQEQSKEQLLNQQNYYKDNISKVEAANSNMCSKIQAQNTQIISLQKEIETLKKKLISANQLSSYNELRLNRNLEETDKLRSSLKISQTEEKESREYIRKIQEEKRLALKVSEKQRTEIFQACKKQMQLVNNLKKQKLYLEVNKGIQFMEKEFTKILEWKNN